jgi:DNA-directed RNA polymerase II subunit RPB1
MRIMVQRMNLLFTRSNRTSNEIRELSSPSQFFIAYKNGNPKIGQAQDSLIGISEFTTGSVRLDKFHAMQMFAQIKVYHDFSQYSKDKMFTGRELVTILLKETKNFINYNGKPKMYEEEYARYRKYDKTDIKVEIDRGDLKTGILDKTSCGEESQGSIFHIIHNQYGPEAALEACYYIQQMSISYIFQKGITISIRDILMTEAATTEIHKIEDSLIQESLQITARLNQGKIIPPIGKTITEYYEEQQQNALNSADLFWPHILNSIDPENNCLYKIIMAGSRGKIVNFTAISSAMGQQDINGERMKETFGGRCLPYFSKYDSHPASRGYIANSYISGLNITEFIFHAQNARYQLINKALSTSITGMQNRMSIKNLEAMLVDNHRRAVNGRKVIQLIYGADGCDPRFIERVKFPTMAGDYTNEIMEQKFHARSEMFGKEFNGAKVKTLLDEEFKQIMTDRKFYTQLFVNMELTSGKIYSDAAVVPVNINRIIEDTVYSLELKKFNPSGGVSPIDPVQTIEKVRKLCESVQYCLLNEIQERKKTPIPAYIQASTTLLQILIRSYLNCSTIVSRGLTNEALDLVIKQIKMTYSKSLISYGKAIGIIAAQSISEPMTQMVLDSHHQSGSGSTRKKGMTRIREILGAKPTDKMKSPSMIIHVLPKYRTDPVKVQEIANRIEMLPLRRFVQSWQIFFESYGNPEHPTYKHEKNVIKEFEKYNSKIKVPSDLANWCVRIALDKSKMIEKQMKVETIYHKIRQLFNFTHIVYTTDNAESVILRIYVRNTFAKKGHITTAQMTDFVEQILDMVVRGIKGIKAAYVKKDFKINEISPNGDIVEQKIFYIFTDGTNLEEVLENPYVDTDSVQSDSIMETYELFGVEASRTKIINELKFQIDGPSHRHYTLYADEMTFNGTVTSIDRFGSAKRDASIMLRISDASPIAVIEESALNAVTDNLTGVSPPIMVGKNPQVGDLYNHFKLDEELVASKIKNLDDILEDL